MIRKLLLPTLAVLLFASCSNKMSLVKRKYNKGFYVSVSKKNNSELLSKTVTAKNKIGTPVEKENAFEVVETQNIQQSELVSQFATPIISLNKKDEKNHTALTASAHSKVNTTPVHHFVKPLKTSNLTKISYAAKAAADSNKIIQIILALFPILCLIAVYLHDNGVTLNFWITLLLHLTFIGAMIFALLVVLDVVNLA